MNNQYLIDEKIRFLGHEVLIFKNILRLSLLPVDRLRKATFIELPRSLKGFIRNIRYSLSLTTFEILRFIL